MSGKQEMNNPFTVSVLETISPFEPNFDSVVVTKRLSKDGTTTYNIYTLSVLGEGLPSPVSVELTRKDWDALRVLGFMGIKSFVCTAKMKRSASDYDEYIFSPSKPKSKGTTS